MALALLAAVASACSDSGGDRALVGYARQPTPHVGDLSLPAVTSNGDEQDFSFAGPEGGLLLVYFGYTSCPDVCPTTLADLRRALDELGPDRAARVELAMITIDPEVDTPEILSSYVGSFVPGAVAIHTTDESLLRPVADRFGADYGKEDVDGTPEVFHTASVYAVDDRGDLLLTWSFGTSAEDVELDLGQLLDQRV